MLLSAVGLGLTAASKYTYCLAGVAILVDWLWATLPAEQQRRSAAAWMRWLAPVVGWGIISIPVFVAFDPRLWTDGIQRLKETVLFHASYAQSAHVQEAGYPVWQPLVWLTSSVPWHPGVFLVMLDWLITLLARGGLAPHLAEAAGAGAVAGHSTGLFALVEYQVAAVHLDSHRAAGRGRRRRGHEGSG